jgi:hypothetical protein
MKWLVLFLMMPALAFASVGTITEQTGPAAEIVRQKNQITANKGTGVQMNDTVSTNKTRLGITFQDNTKVQITEQSKLIIDDFVYDPKQGTGKVAMNVALGTVRMASGAAMKNSKENVKITTPTATISVRGTDFTMTVDEVGRSLIILLPTCPDPKKPDECWTGVIEVATDAGYVLLNQAYQATLVNSRNSLPTDPKIVDVNESFIDNMLIVSPPRNLFTSLNKSDSLESDNGLSRDFLEYKELTKNFLEEDLLSSTELDLNRLTVEFLDNLLDHRTELDQDEFEIDPVLPTIKRFPWVQWAYNEEAIYLYKERPPHIAEIRTTRNATGMVNITQDGIAANIQLNDGGTNVVINIIQNQ